jgi:hypothetical protein
MKCSLMWPIADIIASHGVVGPDLQSCHFVTPLVETNALAIHHRPAVSRATCKTRPYFDHDILPGPAAEHSLTGRASENRPVTVAGVPADQQSQPAAAAARSLCCCKPERSELIINITGSGYPPDQIAVPNVKR